MPTPRKRAMVRDLQDRFTGSEVLIFTDHRGLSVSEITNLPASYETRAWSTT